jgi:NDP-sugar pyrophosphorylase family protein
MENTWCSPTTFFDLTKYAHRSLFEQSSAVWNVLEKLEGYLHQQKLGVIEGVIEPGAFLINPESISIGAGTVVEAGAYIRGPCVIGKNCQIRHTAYIRGVVLVGDRCVIGHASEVKHSVFLDHAKAAHFAFVGDSILGNDVNLGAGVRCANLRLDEQPVSIRYHGEVCSTGLRKCGVFLGDGCQIGCNSVLNPGTLMGKRAQCFPCVNCGGFVEAGVCVRRRSS